jgi:hypothetical protein
MKKLHLLILMIVTTGLLASCSFTDHTAKRNYDNKSNSVTSGKIVKRKYQKGFYADLSKRQIPKKNISSHDTTTNLPVVKKTAPEQTEDNNQANDVSFQSDDNSNLLASNNKNDIVIANNKSGFSAIPITVNKPVKTFKIIQTARTKFFEHKAKESDDNKIGSLTLASCLLVLFGAGLLCLPVSATMVGVISVIAMIAFALAIILGYIGKHKMSTSHNEIKGKGIAILGIILGWIGFFIALLVLLLTL